MSPHPRSSRSWLVTEIEPNEYLRSGSAEVNLKRVKPPSATPVVA